MAAKVKAAPKAGVKKAAPAKKEVKPAGPGAIAAGGGLGAFSAAADVDVDDGAPKEVESFTATGIDNALDLLEVVNAKMDKASIGSKAADLERHPEVRTATDRQGCVLILPAAESQGRIRGLQGERASEGAGRGTSLDQLQYILRC